MTAFTVFGRAATKGSTVSFLGKHGIVVKQDCKTLASWSRAVGYAARAHQVPLAAVGEPVYVAVTFQFERSKHHRKRVSPTVKPDIDKLLRALLDALTGIAYVDDSQVVEVFAKKRYGDEAQTIVAVRYEP